MRIVHNTSIYGVLELIKDEIEEVEYDLDLALDELMYALESGDILEVNVCINKAIKLIKGAKDKIQIK